MAEASYLVVSEYREASAAWARLLRRIIGTLAEQFEAFLLVELWSGEHSPERDAAHSAEMHSPGFVIHARKHQDTQNTAEVLRAQLSKIKIRSKVAEVTVKSNTTAEGGRRGSRPSFRRKSCSGCVAPSSGSR
jgi:hypothetical protein